MFKKKRFYFLLSFFTLILNSLAALLEGVSFALIGLSLLYLNGNQPVNLPIWMQDYLPQLERVEAFFLLMLGAVSSQILRSAFTYFGQMLSMFIAVTLQTASQHKIYQQIFTLSFAQVSRYKLGDLMDYATAPAFYFRIIADSANRVIVAAMMMVAYIILMMRISLPLTGCTLILFGLSVFLQKALIKKIMKASDIQTAHLVNLNESTAQNLSGLRQVHLFHQYEAMITHIQDTLKKIVKIALRLNKWNQLILPFNEALSILLVGISMTLGLIFLKGQQSEILPLLFTFLALTYRLGTRMQIAMSGVGEIAFNLGPLKRLRNILSNQNKEFVDLSAKPPVQFDQKIQFKEVCLKYPEQNIYALRNLSLTIPKGCITAFVGGSGGGKSSCLDLLLRLYDPSEGEILIDNKPLKDMCLKSWRALCGVVSQDVFLFHDTIAHNISYGMKDVSQEQIVEAASLSGAHSFIEPLPKKYDTLVGEKGYRLSGGQKQRISLARALIRKPKILVLDEATSHLDSESEKKFQEALENLKGKITILVVAHRLATIRLADQIILIEKGHLVERGTHADLIRLGGRYHHFWTLQAVTH